MVTIRTATVTDANCIREIYSPFVHATPVTFDLEPPSVGFFQEKIADLLTRYPVLVAALGEQVVGYSYASPHNLRPAYRWTVEVSVYVSASYHRRGVGRALYERLITTLQEQGFRTALAGITLPNDASVALHEAFGFDQVALLPKVGYKLGGWRDVSWWSLDLQPGLLEPSEPIAFSALP